VLQRFTKNSRRNNDLEASALAKQWYISIRHRIKIDQRGAGNGSVNIRRITTTPQVTGTLPPVARRRQLSPKEQRQRIIRRDSNKP